MSVDRPRVSVCIPTYKGARTIGAAMDSVLAQTFADFELIVVDDGSPDHTAAVVSERRDDRIRLVRNPGNLGPQGNWNRCLELARGDCIKLLPHDDLLHPECLARQLQVLDDDVGGAVALVCCARDVIGPDGRVLLRARGFPGAPQGPMTRDDVLRQCLRRGTNLIGEPGAVLFRRELAQRIGGFDMRHPYVIDLEYWLRLLQHGQAWYSPEALASFRVWGGSWSVAIGTGQSADFRALMRDVSAGATPSATAWDRLCGRFSPTLNSLLRQVFYRLFV
jgi:glycosyltransferase involved in cell wall biosynthesis